MALYSYLSPGLFFRDGGRAQTSRKPKKTIQTKDGWAKHRQTIEKTKKNKKNHRFETLQVTRVEHSALPVVLQIDCFFVFFGFLDGLAMLSPTVFGFYGFWGFSDGSVRSNLVIYIVYMYTLMVVLSREQLRTMKQMTPTERICYTKTYDASWSSSPPPHVITLKGITLTSKSPGT